MEEKGDKLLIPIHFCQDLQEQEEWELPAELRTFFHHYKNTQCCDNQMTLL